MEVTLLHMPEYRLLDRQMARWYHAATLTERLASLPSEKRMDLLASRGDTEQGLKKLKRWKEQSPFEKGTFFVDRLNMDALSEQELLALLSEPVEAVQERFSQAVPPDWLVSITHALETYTSPETMAQLFNEIAPDSDGYAILQPFYPLLQNGVEQFQRGLAEISAQNAHLPYNPDTLVSLLLPNLARQITPKLSKAVVLEMHVARLRGVLQGETPQERFRYYLQYLSGQEQFRAFLEEYCILARQLMITINQWAECGLELAQRLCQDWKQIQATFLPEQDPGLLTEVLGGAGDTHRNGHSVMILKFHSGWQVIYKPRSLSIDIHFQALLNWLNAHGTHPPFRTLRVIDRETYGWVEFIHQTECASEEEVRRFYERQGGYLALLYALEAADFHYENIIASGEHPLLVDLEALFHPRTRGENIPALHYPVRKALAHSVLRIALLPEHLWSDDEHRGIDISGLGNLEGLSSPMPQWKGVGTDEMKLIHERVKMQGGKNSPKLHGQEVQALKYIESIERGFVALYRLLIKHRDAFLAKVLPTFAHDEIRFIARSTRNYASLLNESFHPNILRDALKRERFFDSLWMAAEYQPHLQGLIPAERADLFRGDIPLFTTTPESHDLFSSQGKRISEFFNEPSMMLVRKRLQDLDEEDLQRQIWLIRASFASTPAASMSGVMTQSSGPLLPVNRESILSGSCAIGDRLCSLALHHNDMVDWLGITCIKERDWNIMPAGIDLYDGLSGIILFLSYLGAITSKDRYTTCAVAALKTLRTLIEDLITREAEQLSIGAFRGIGSCIYLFSHLAALWRDQELVLEAEALVQALPKRIATDSQFGIIEGAAGCLASLLSLYAFSPNATTLAVAMQCGDRLLACISPLKEGVGWKTGQQESPLTGFAHGAAGIIWSLLMLADVSGEGRFRQCALAGLTYERSLFSHEQCNWLDLRKRPSTEQQQNDQQEQYSMSWSHGTPGIVLARLASLPYLDDKVTRWEIEAGLTRIVEKGFRSQHEHKGLNHSLAHGDCGTLETVLVASQSPGMQQYREPMVLIAAQLLADINQQRWLTGVPLNVETPGFMTGLAGIGYQLLRLAEPEKVPSVLVLAPPPCLGR